ncbi:MAG: serine/threonine-protein kinase, partial [Gemmataceae bacterium]
MAFFRVEFYYAVRRGPFANLSRAIMDPNTPPALFAALRESGQLSPEQSAVLDSCPITTANDPAALAECLLQHRILTAYQARKVRIQRINELLVGQYLIQDKIGEGGMGKVYRAVQMRMGRVVALKIVRTHLMSNKTVMKRYKREAAAAAALNHPNIVTLFDADEALGRHYLAMEYVEGLDLSRMVKEYGPLPYAEACEYIRQSALGLQHAHDAELIHRDIKPSNLLVTGERAIPGTGGKALVKVLDMGLVRSLTEDEDSSHSEVTRDGT